MKRSTLAKIILIGMPITLLVNVWGVNYFSARDSVETRQKLDQYMFLHEEAMLEMFCPNLDKRLLSEQEIKSARRDIVPHSRSFALDLIHPGLDNVPDRNKPDQYVPLHDWKMPNPPFCHQ